MIHFNLVQPCPLPLSISLNPSYFQTTSQTVADPEVSEREAPPSSQPVVYFFFISIINSMVKQQNIIYPDSLDFWEKIPNTKFISDLQLHLFYKCLK